LRDFCNLLQKCPVAEYGLDMMVGYLDWFPIGDAAPCDGTLERTVGRDRILSATEQIFG
tara:strand:- start:545 stop:721 length:177 start_codon:yes stop_codon:yes gene_type:complete